MNADSSTAQTQQRRGRARQFQRPTGDALVAKVEPLTVAPTPETEVLAEPPAAASGEQPQATSETRARRNAGARPAAAKPGPNPAEADAELPMPRPRHSEIRIQFNTKLRPVVIERTKRFAEHHRGNIQEIVEQALDEYLTRRGWAEGS